MKILIAGIPEETPKYQAALASCGIPFEVSLTPEDADIYNGLILPGGADILPSLFHQENNGSRSIDAETDLAQLRILEHFEKSGKPILGICKGMQLLNIYFGGDICQDLPTNWAHQHTDTDQLHAVHSTPGSIMARLYGEDCIVNSSHHQGCGRIADCFLVTQTSPDHVIEAIEHKTAPILGVQWHPERIAFDNRRPDTVDGGLVIRYFLDLCQAG
ncbi:MAG: gamma-glutamyl-gamma-aminobutyrate hydrolase family protein [Lachnospiraceae bacterium]|nr:gamma-glutamyl-gamma-aminobutyrate hydrolase family protein [Lachnospiraceae bacterium]